MFVRHPCGRALLVFAAFGLQMAPAIAQPTAQQQNALRSNCRSDFMSHCAGVQPGGAEALQCLQRNVATLSRGCQSAVNALAAPPAPQPAAATAPPPAAAAQAAPASAAPSAGAPTPQQRDALRQFCGADYMAKCGNVAPATAAALQCLQSHEPELSANCRGALTLFGVGGSPASPAPTATPVSAPAAAPPAAAPAAAPAPHKATLHPAPAAAAKPAAVKKPTAQQQAAIRQSCQGDFMSHCSGVQPGGAAALQCLQRNSASLSPNCRGAIAAIGGAAPATATASAPPPAAAAPSQQQLGAVKASCQRDFMMNCRGVQPGGPEALACLQRNSARLSPSCQSSLAAIAGGAPAQAAAVPAEPAPAAQPAGGPLRRAIMRRRMMAQ